MESKLRATWIFGTLTALSAAALALVPRIPQPQDYHDFADQRAFLGIPNACDVLSNVGFLVVGVLGLIWLARRGTIEFADVRERTAWNVFFAGVALTAFGSGYYHLKPNDATLVWDRLPMTLGFMGVFAANISERVSPKLGRSLLWPLVAFGGASVAYWIWTETSGAGDLRPYFFVQFYTLAAIPLLLWLFRPRYTHGPLYLTVLGGYVAAKLTEIADRPIFAATGSFVSGHTIKHIFAAVGAGILLGMLLKRKALLGAEALEERAATAAV